MRKLIVSLDGAVIREIPLTRDHTTLGRRPYNDIVLDSMVVSGEHATFHLRPEDVCVEDLDSTNGTYVNGRLVKKQILQHNDLLEVGKYKIRYLADASVQGAAGAAAWRPAARRPEAAPDTTFEGAPTIPAPLGGVASPALMRVVEGIGAGREVPLKKVVTTIGKPGVAVAAVTSRLEGYVVTAVDGVILLNGRPMGAEAVPLHNGDLLELAASRMQFVVPAAA